MFIAYAITAGLMSALSLFSAGGKLTRQKPLVDQMTNLAVPLGILPFLGGAQIAGASGLVIGIWYGPLGIAAAGGMVLYFIGAVGAHLRAKDAIGSIPAAILAIISILLMVLRASSL